MKVKTLGNKENPAIVMIPGMFCNSDMPEIIGRRLEDGFYIILPTLDGHHKEEPVYHSKKKDGAEIKQWLKDNGVDHLALLQGTSMGAEVALETARQPDIAVDHYLYDGGPFFNFPLFFRVFMANKFMKCEDGLCRAHSHGDRRGIRIRAVWRIREQLSEVC